MHENDSSKGTAFFHKFAHIINKLQYSTKKRRLPTRRKEEYFDRVNKFSACYMADRLPYSPNTTAIDNKNKQRSQLGTGEGTRDLDSYGSYTEIAVTPLLELSPRNGGWV